MKKDQNTLTEAMLSENTLVYHKHKGNSDAKQIAGKEDYEVAYVSYSYGIPMDVIRQVIKEYKSSRKRVYAILRKMGYIIDTKNRRK
jgi:pyruvate formate-lyase activating enzyme-like uncharacterized protein